MARPTGTRSGHAAFLTTRFGRRLFAVFVGAALLPVAVLATVSFHTVTDELYDQADSRLHRSARAAGMLIAGRLFAIADPAGGGFLAPPSNAQAEVRLSVVSDAPEAPSRLVLESGRGEAVVRREVPLQEVFGDLEGLVLPDRGEFVVLSQGRLVATSLPLADPRVLPAAWRAQPPGRELLRWSHDGSDYLGRARELFLRAALSAPAWTVVVLEPRDEVVAPVVAFRRALVAAVALTLLVVPLLALRQIRLRLVPLERLREGADRIGAGDLTARVPVTGDDELAALGSAFNRMGEDLDRHFRALDILLEIDREIVAAEDAPALAAVLVRGAFALEACDAVVVAFAEGGDPDGPSGWIGEDPRTALRRGPAPSATEAAAWSGWAPVDRPLGPDELGVLEPLAACGVRFVRVVPMAAAGVPLGALILGRREGAYGAADPVAYVRQLADQASTALSHLRERERRRALAYYDAATGLPNRFMFRERLQQALLGDRAGAPPLAVCVIAVDGIARILETLGHSAAQPVLQAVADRLATAHGGGGIFRLDRSEFAALVPDLDSTEAAARVTRRLLDALARPFPHDVEEVTLTAHAGVAVHPQDGADVEVLERNARAALRAARTEGGDPYRFYSPEMNLRARARLSMEAELRRALRRDELTLAYQPILDLGDDSLLGAEALARWSRDGEPVSPAVFIPLAEEAGLVGELGRWVLRAACRELALWLRLAPDLDMHVNVSPLQIRDGTLPALVRSCLAESGVPGRTLTLEITESALTEQGDATRQLLHALDRLGVHLAIDDFGTGYSSLAQLRSLPAQVLKIDRCFVERVPDDRGDAALVRAIVDLAHGRGMRVVAEGVETEAQLAFLREAGCDAAQGFLFAEPLPADAFRKRLEESAKRGDLR